MEFKLYEVRSALAYFADGFLKLDPEQAAIRTNCLDATDDPEVFRIVQPLGSFSSGEIVGATQPPLNPETVIEYEADVPLFDEEPE